MKINVIGDIAGRFDELMELLGKMPAADIVLAVGDLVDRGSQSKQVIDWFMGDPVGRNAVHANHENMLLDAHRNYSAPGLHPYWFYNGGDATMDSYGLQPIPENVLQWLERRPQWFRQDGLFVSHAPVMNVKNLPLEWTSWQRFVGDEGSWPWNRILSRNPMPGHFMVYGHNARFVETRGCLVDAEDNITDPNYHYATCLDNSRHRELMGMAWPSKELFKVDYHQ